MSREITTTESFSRCAQVLLAVRSRPNVIALQKILEADSVRCIKASDWQGVVEAIESDVDLLVMSEAALSEQKAAAQIAEKLLAQPKWSNISTILLLRGKKRSPNFKTFWDKVAHRRSVLLLQTPIKPSVFVSIVRACWQDRQRQYALKVALDDLSESNRTLESFSYTAAHELRNPLGILNSSFGILDRTALSEKQAKFVDMGLRTVRAMDQTLQALLDYGKLQVGDRQDFQLVSMNSVAVQSVEGLQALIDDRDANVSWKDLPKVQGNQQLLVQLMSNLIKNAIVHNPNSAPQVTIQAALTEDRPDADRWFIHVKDSGPGISEDNQKRVFALFDRAGKSRAEGSGIGLALCRRIVEQHGGELKVRSEIGHGSDFFFDLPSAA